MEPLDDIPNLPEEIVDDLYAWGEDEHVSQIVVLVDDERVLAINP